MHRQTSRSRLAAATLTLAALGAAHAHVTLEQPVAFAGGSYKATFQVGHGCGASPTRQLAVDIPAGVTSARPMPKPHWSLEVQRRPGADEEVARVTWTASPEGQLPSGHYDEFVLLARLPAQPGLLHWPVRQVCAEGQADWTVPPPARPGSPKPKFPAPVLQVLPAAGAQHTH